MSPNDLLRLAFAGVHDALREDLAAVDPSMLFVAPAPAMNHAGFLFWHLVRDEHLVVHDVCGGDTLWAAEGWADRLGVRAVEQGTGFEVEQALGVRYEVPEFMGYAERVWAASDGLLQSLSDIGLERRVYNGEWTAATLLLDGCRGHNWGHLGEIRYALGLQGWKFRE